MASQNSSAALCADAHPLARPGYGKRSAPHQQPSRPGDFAHLPRREASIAAYLDRLPDGADISVKTLAKVLPDYGQCALRTALRHLSEAGHLRRFTEIRGARDGSPRWVTRTYFTRTARDDTWWATLGADNVPPEHSPAPNPKPQPHQPAAPSTPSTTPPRSPAYAALAALGRTEPRMTLSAADCAALEPLAAEWLARGATPTHLTQALTAGLPPSVHHPGRLAHSRLTTKLPPEPTPQASPPPPPPPPLRLMECTTCAAPGRPEALPGGLCTNCRGESPPRTPPLPPSKVHAHVQHLRAANRPPHRSRV